MGRRRVAVIDPGPGLAAHVAAVAAAVSDAESVTIVLTHGHADHAGAALALSARLGAPVVGAWGPAPGEAFGAAHGEGEATRGGPPEGAAFRRLADGEAVSTDAGDVIAVATPGHAREHLCFLWRDRGAVFVGDLLLGTGDTTWVGEYAGCVADYLASLDRVERLRPSVLLPAHGPAIMDPAERIARYRGHRTARVAAVERALVARPDASVDDLLREVYPSLRPEVAAAARASLEALVAHVRGS